MLRLDQVRAGYGGGTVLHEVTLAVPAGSVYAIVGHNGAGKTTLVHTVAGLMRPTSGRIAVAGRDLTRLPAHRRARAGLGLVPQGRRVFGSLTVDEHLAIAYRGGRRPAAGSWTPDHVLDLLPQLATRRRHRGGQLSGGEQQMLAVARALLTQPRLLLLDEPTEGLAPAVVGRIRELIGELAATGLTILLTAPHPELPLAVADEVSVLTGGRCTDHWRGESLREDPAPLLAALTPADQPAQFSTGTAFPSGTAFPGGTAVPAPDPPPCANHRR